MIKLIFVFEKIILKFFFEKKIRIFPDFFLENEPDVILDQWTLICVGPMFDVDNTGGSGDVSIAISVSCEVAPDAVIAVTFATYSVSGSRLSKVTKSPSELKSLTSRRVDRSYNLTLYEDADMDLNQVTVNSSFSISTKSASGLGMTIRAEVVRI